MSDENKFTHLEALRDDVRDEIKRRIQQRDQYSMQLTVALGAIAVGAFSAKGTTRLFIVAPIVSTYFTALILYSYGIHDMLAAYLRNEIEPQFQTFCNMPTDSEWENWYKATGKRPGVRRWFFRFEMWTVTVLSLWFLWHSEGGFVRWFRSTVSGGESNWFQVVLAGACVLYFCAMVWVALLPGELKLRGRNRDWPIRDAKPHRRRAVFLDRDGTINMDTHFPYRLEDLELLPRAREGLNILARLPVDIIVVANQAGIALGFFTREQMSRFNTELRHQAEAAGARIDAFYFCPHREPKHLRAGEIPCDCSKPAPGMLLKAAHDFDINLRRSFLIGDKTSDIAAGQAAGCVTILVRTGKAGKEEGALPVQPTHVAETLLEASLIVKGYFETESAKKPVSLDAAADSRVDESC